MMLAEQGGRMIQRQRFVCPFCHETVVETDWPIGFDLDAVERDLRKHVTSRHRIRSLLSRRWRRALKSEIY